MAETTEQEVKLTDKQEKFCIEYLVDLNATQAAIRAGYSPDSARHLGYETMTKPYILVRIKALMDERSKNTMVDATFVVEGFKQVFDRCMQKTPVMVYNPGDRCMEQKTEVDEEGNEQGIWEFDSQGANKALEMLGRHLAMFTDKTKAEDKKDITVTVIRGNRNKAE
jgi:phage terminase small subunit